MEFQFSEKLRLWAIAYFEKRTQAPVSHERADLYLAELADLFLAFETVENDKRRGLAPETNQSQEESS